MATLLLATFATLLFVATRRVDIVALGAAVFAAGAYWASRHFAYVHARIAIWRNPFADPLGAGYQSSQAYYALAAGGLFGTGFRLGHPTFIPEVATDYVYAAISEEFGLLGAAIVLAIFIGLVRRILAAGLEQPDLYAKLLAVGLGTTLGVQVFIIVGGVVGLVSAHRHHVALRFVRRQFARRQLSAGRAGVGDERAAVADSNVKAPFAALLLAAFALAGCARGNAGRGNVARPNSIIRARRATAGESTSRTARAAISSTGAAFPARSLRSRGNRAVTGDPRRAIAAVKFGLRGPLPASGAGGEMPAWNGLAQRRRNRRRRHLYPVRVAQRRLTRQPSAGAGGCRRAGRAPLDAGGEARRGGGPE